jgi:hypothetical protein
MKVSRTSTPLSESLSMVALLLISCLAFVGMIAYTSARF